MKKVASTRYVGWIQHQLHKYHGLELPTDRIWTAIMEDAGRNEQVAGEMAETIAEDREALARFSQTFSVDRQRQPQLKLGPCLQLEQINQQLAQAALAECLARGIRTYSTMDLIAVAFFSGVFSASIVYFVAKAVGGVLS